MKPGAWGKQVPKLQIMGGKGTYQEQGTYWCGKEATIGRTWAGTTPSVCGSEVAAWGLGGMWMNTVCGM